MKRRDPELDDYVAKIRQAMDAKADPLRSAIIKAICDSTDPRVTAIRRKSSWDQLRTLTECVASAVVKQHDRNQTGLGCNGTSDTTAPNCEANIAEGCDEVEGQGRSAAEHAPNSPSHLEAVEAARRLISTDEGGPDADDEIEYLDAIAVARALLSSLSEGNRGVS